MPRLPDESTYGARPTPRVVGVPGYDASTLARAANIQPDLGGAANLRARAIGTATSGVASGLAKAGDAMLESQALVDAASAKSTFLNAKIKADEAFEEDPEYSTWAKRYEQTLKDAATESSKGLSGRARLSFDLAAQDTIGRSVAAMREKARGREKDENRGWLNSFIDGSMDGALKAKDEPTRAQFLDGISEAVDGMKGRAFITSQEAEKLKRGAVEGYAKRKAASMDPKELIAALDNPEGGFAQFLSPDEVVRFRTAAEEKIVRDEARARAELARGQQAFEADAAVRVSRGEMNHATLDRLRSEKKIDDGAWARLTIARDEFIKKEVETAGLLARGLSFGRGAFADPKSKEDKKAVDVAFAATMQTWATLPPEEQMDRAIAFSAEKGIAPEPLRAVVRSGLRSGDPAQAVLAADTMEKLRNANPLLLDDFDKEDLRLGFSIQAYTSAGVPPKSAVQLAMDGMKLDKSTREVRERAFDDERGASPDTRRKADVAWLEGKKNSLWARDPTVPPEMMGDFERVAREEYIRTGNLEAARSMALSTVDRVWGRSEVGGTRRYMKFAPEKFYGVTPNDPASDSKWMSEQLLGDVTKGALIDPSNPITADRLHLLPDATRTSADGRPAYIVMLERKDGAEGIPTWTAVVNERGEPIRWVPDWNSSAEKARREAEQQKQIETLRKDREKRMGSMKGLGVVGEVLPEAKSALPR